jgi:hypothetical protein
VLKKEMTVLFILEYENEIEKIDNIMSSIEETKKLFNEVKILNLMIMLKN